MTLRFYMRQEFFIQYKNCSPQLKAESKSPCFSFPIKYKEAASASAVVNLLGLPNLPDWLPAVVATFLPLGGTFITC